MTHVTHMTHMRTRFLIPALLVLGLTLAAKLSAQPLTTPVNLTPDCLIFFDFSSTPNASASFDNRFIGCDSWTVDYTNTGFGAVFSVTFQSSPDSNGSPSGFVAFAGTVVAGINPNTSLTQASSNFKGFYPWLNVAFSATSGAGRVRGTFYGYRSVPTPYVVLASGITIGTVNQGNPNTATNRWPVYLSDGTNPQGALTNPLFSSGVCNLSAPISLSLAGNTQVVALSAGQKVHVCHFSVSADTPVDIQLTSWTAAACTGASTALSGVYKSVWTMALDFPAPLTGPASGSLCVNLGTAVTTGGLLTYVVY
jgi:hypothetical protein